MISIMASTRSTQIENPWGSRAFVSRIAAQISMPYKKPPAGVNQIMKRNGDLTVTLSANGKELPYGRYPRLIELWLTTMVKTKNPCVELESRTVEIGSTFRGFMKTIGTPIGGKQMRGIKAQIESWLGSTYAITSNTGRYSRGLQFPIGEKWRIDWLQHEPQEDALFKNYFIVSQEYLEMLQDRPIPVNLEVIAKLRRPMSIDIYCWLQRRFSYLHEPQTITWDQLRAQFGSDAVNDSKFRQSFKNALKDVTEIWPDARITCGRTITLYPSRTTTATKNENKKIAATRKQARELSDVTIGRIMEKSKPDDDHYVTARRIIAREWAQGSSEDSIIETIKRECAATEDATQDATE
jgi:hypothetical protein